MSKKSEATAHFDNLEKVFDDKISAYTNFIENVVKAIEQDIKNAGYGEQKPKSETMKFLNAITPYRKIEENLKSTMKEEYNNLMRECFETVKEDSWGLKLQEDKDGILTPNGISVDVKGFWAEVNKRKSNTLKKVSAILSSDFYPKISDEFKDFKKALDKQNKRRWLGHISKFCNKESIRTLGRAPEVLKEYQKEVADYFSKNIFK